MVDLLKHLWRILSGAAEREYRERMDRIDQQLTALTFVADATHQLLEDAQRAMDDVRCVVKEFTESEVEQ